MAANLRAQIGTELRKEAADTPSGPAYGATVRQASASQQASVQRTSHRDHGSKTCTHLNVVLTEAPATRVRAKDWSCMLAANRRVPDDANMGVQYVSASPAEPEQSSRSTSPTTFAMCY